MPHALVRKAVEVRVTRHTIEILYGGKREALAVTRFDQEEAFRHMRQKLVQGQSLDSFERRMYRLDQPRADQEAETARTGAAAPAAEEQFIFPFMTDDDAAALRIAGVRFATRTRRNGGG